MLPVLKLPYNPDNTIVRGDTWNGVSFTIQSGDPLTAVNLTGASVKCTFVHPQHSFTVATGGDGITITNAAAGQLKIDKISPLDVPAGVYKGDLQVTLSDGDIVTYLTIELTITDDKTK